MPVFQVDHGFPRQTATVATGTEKALTFLPIFKIFTISGKCSIFRGCPFAVEEIAIFYESVFRRHECLVFCFKFFVRAEKLPFFRFLSNSHQLRFTEALVQKPFPCKPLILDEGHGR